MLTTRLTARTVGMESLCGLEVIVYSGRPLVKRLSAAAGERGTAGGRKEGGKEKVLGSQQGCCDWQDVFHPRRIRRKNTPTPATRQARPPPTTNHTTCAGRLRQRKRRFPANAGLKFHLLIS